MSCGLLNVTMATKTSILYSRVEKKPTVLVKPSRPTPHRLLSLSTLDNDPLNELTAKTIHVYAANHENGGKDPVSLIQEALAAVLVYFYPFAGKERRRSSDRRLELICNEEGVPFIAAIANCSLSDVDYLAGYDREAMAQVLVPNYGVSRGYDMLYHPLALQVTRFSCGGFTVGWICTHTVSDGSARALFFQALAELASGRTEPTVQPVWEREKLVARYDDDLKNQDCSQPLYANGSSVLAMSPYMPTNDVVSEIVPVTARNIKALKATAMRESGDDHTSGVITTFEVLAAYVWRSRTRAMEIKPDETVLLSIVFGIRKLLDPPLPEGYYGNTILEKAITLTRREIDELSLYQIVKLIKKLKQTLNSNKCVQEEIRNTARRMSLNMNLFEDNKGGGALVLTDWRNLGFVERVADFGWKSAVDVIPVVSVEKMRLWTFLPPLRVDGAVANGGGARVMTTLPRAAMPRFKQEMEALNMLEF